MKTVVSTVLLPVHSVRVSKREDNENNKNNGSVSGMAYSETHTLCP